MAGPNVACCFWSAPVLRCIRPCMLPAPNPGIFAMLLLLSRCRLWTLGCLWAPPSPQRHSWRRCSGACSMQSMLSRACPACCCAFCHLPATQHRGQAGTCAECRKGPHAPAQRPASLCHACSQDLRHPNVVLTTKFAVCLMEVSRVGASLPAALPFLGLRVFEPKRRFWGRDSEHSWKRRRAACRNLGPLSQHSKAAAPPAPRL